MARIRTIKPEYWTNSTTGQLSGDACKLYLGLHNHCDDYGVIRYDEAEFRARILPYARQGAVPKAIKELEDAGADENPFGLIVLFRVNRKRYLWLSYFTKHQKVDKPGQPLVEGWTALSTPLEYADSENVRESSRTFANVLSSRARGGEERRGEERSGEDRIATRQTARPRNTEWDALAKVFGYSPKNKDEQKLWGKLSQDLASLSATSETLAEAAKRYRASMPNAELTPPALVKHYQRLMAQNGSPHVSEIGAQARRLLGEAR